MTEPKITRSRNLYKLYTTTNGKDYLTGTCSTINQIKDKLKISYTAVATYVKKVKDGTEGDSLLDGKYKIVIEYIHKPVTDTVANIPDLYDLYSVKDENEKFIQRCKTNKEIGQLTSTDDTTFGKYMKGLPKEGEAPLYQGKYRIQVVKLVPAIPEPKKE